MRSKSTSDFYVYALFDQHGIPRYVGKGKGRRIHDHERKSDKNNSLKRLFIEKTIAALGELPKIKIQENLTEDAALEIERIFIKVIGRHPNGPLTNATAGGQGLSGYQPTEKTRRLISENSKRAMARLSPDSRVALATHASLFLPPEIRQSNAKERWAKRSAPERSEIIKKGHNTFTALERSQKAMDRWATRSSDQRSEIYNKTLGTMSAERRIQAGRAGAMALTFEQRSAAGKRCAVNMTEQQKIDRARKGWATRRAKELLAQDPAIPDQNS